MPRGIPFRLAKLSIGMHINAARVPIIKGRSSERSIQKRYTPSITVKRVVARYIILLKFFFLLFVSMLFMIIQFCDVRNAQQLFVSRFKPLTDNDGQLFKYLARDFRIGIE